MKKPWMITCFFLLYYSFGLFAQTPVYGANNDTLGYFADNHFEDFSMTTLIDFSVPGQVIDVAQDTVAHYNDVSGNITDINNDLLYTVDSSGTVKNVLGNITGYVDGTGHVYDIDHQLLGLCASMNRYALVFYFFVYRMM